MSLLRKAEFVRHGFVRHGSSPTKSGFVRLGFVGQLPCRIASCISDAYVAPRRAPANERIGNLVHIGEVPVAYAILVRGSPLFLLCMDYHNATYLMVRIFASWNILLWIRFYLNAVLIKNLILRECFWRVEQYSIFNFVLRRSSLAVLWYSWQIRHDIVKKNLRKKVSLKSWCKDFRKKFLW